LSYIFQPMWWSKHWKKCNQIGQNICDQNPHHYPMAHFNEKTFLIKLYLSSKIDPKKSISVASSLHFKCHIKSFKKKLFKTNLQNLDQSIHHHLKISFPILMFLTTIIAWLCILNNVTIMNPLIRSIKPSLVFKKI
jgi:hypothetical protein